MISAPESMPTEINFGFSAAVPPAHGNGDFNSTAFSSMVWMAVSKELSSSSLSSASCLSRAAMSLFPLLGH